MRMGLLRLVGSFKLNVSSAKEPYKRDYILQKRPIILRSLLLVATPQHAGDVNLYMTWLNTNISSNVCTIRAWHTGHSHNTHTIFSPECHLPHKRYDCKGPSSTLLVICISRVLYIYSQSFSYHMFNIHIYISIICICLIYIYIYQSYVSYLYNMWIFVCIGSEYSETYIYHMFNIHIYISIICILCVYYMNTCLYWKWVFSDTYVSHV